jgi:WD40 repeat protein
MRAALKFLLIVALLSTATAIFAQEPLRTTGVTWSPDGRLIAVSSTDGHITLIDASSGTIVGGIELSVESSVNLTWNPDGTRLATVSYADGVIQIWDTSVPTKPQFVARLPEQLTPEQGGTLLSWNSTGDYLAGTSLRGHAPSEVFIWQVNGDTWTTLNNQLSVQPYDLVWSSDGQTLAIATSNDNLIVDVASSEVNERFRFGDFRFDLAINPSGGKIAGILKSYVYLVPQENENSIEIRDLQTGEVVTILNNTVEPVIMNLTWLTDTYLLADNVDGSAIVWDTRTGEVINTLTLPRDGGRWLMAVSPFGGRVAFGNAAPSGVLRTEGRALSPNIEIIADGQVMFAVPLATEDVLREVLSRCGLASGTSDALAAGIDRAAMPAFIAEVESLPADAMIPACKADLLAVARALSQIE